MSAIYLHLAISNFMVTSCRPSHRYIMSHDRDRNWPAIGPWYSALWPWRRSKGQQPSLFLVLRHSNQPQFEGDKTQVGVQTSVFELDLFSILFYFGIRTNRTLTKRQIQKSKSLCIKIQYMTKEKMAEGLNDAVKSISFETKSRFAILIILVFLFISWTILWWVNFRWTLKFNLPYSVC